MNKVLKVVELFAGLGTPIYSLNNIGIKTIQETVENNEPATISYNAIHNSNIKPISVIGYHAKMKNIDLLFHGSPCQDFSLAGKRKGGEKGSGTRSSLLFESVRIITESKPKVVIWENVIGAKKTNAFKQYLNEMEELGYKNIWRVLKGSDIGFPQKRPRIFVISKLGENDFNFDNINKHYSTMKLIETAEPTKTIDPMYFPTPKGITWMKKFVKGKWGSYIENDDSLGVAVTTRQTLSYRGNYYKYQTKDLTTAQKEWMTKHGRVIPETEGYRFSTPLESFKQMGWSKEAFDKIKNVNRENLFKQAGNGIIVQVLEAIFTELYKK